MSAESKYMTMWVTVHLEGKRNVHRIELHGTIEQIKKSYELLCEELKGSIIYTKDEFLH